MRANDPKTYLDLKGACLKALSPGKGKTGLVRSFTISCLDPSNSHSCEDIIAVRNSRASIETNEYPAIFRVGIGVNMSF